MPYIETFEKQPLGMSRREFEKLFAEIMEIVRQHASAGAEHG